jgi:hypothetical protein
MAMRSVRVPRRSSYVLTISLVPLHPAASSVLYFYIKCPVSLTHIQNGSLNIICFSLKRQFSKVQFPVVFVVSWCAMLSAYLSYK